jgi:hypothetical protein
VAFSKRYRAKFLWRFLFGPLQIFGKIRPVLELGDEPFLASTHPPINHPNDFMSLIPFLDVCLKECWHPDLGSDSHGDGKIEPMSRSARMRTT